MKDHDRDFFYKYTSAKVAKLVLRSLRLRWSSPTLFNDPFDTAHGLQIQARSDTDAQEFREAVEPFMRSDNPLPAGIHPDLAAIILLGRHLRRGGILDDALKATDTFFSMKSGFGSLGVGMMQEDKFSSLNSPIELSAVGRMQKEWWEERVKSMRVLCVSETNDNVPMWSHYADDHRGVVLQLQVVESLGTALCAARRVEYLSEPPVFATTGELLKIMLGTEPLDMASRTSRLLFSKGKQWEHEREWRCWIGGRAPTGDLFEDHPIHLSEISDIYLGQRISEEDYREIVGYARIRLPNVQFWQARKGWGAPTYNLSFEPLGR